MEDTPKAKAYPDVHLDEDDGDSNSVTASADCEEKIWRPGEGWVSDPESFPWDFFVAEEYDIVGRISPHDVDDYFDEAEGNLPANPAEWNPFHRQVLNAGNPVEAMMGLVLDFESEHRIMSCNRGSIEREYHVVEKEDGIHLKRKEWGE